MNKKKCFGGGEPTISRPNVRPILFTERSGRSAIQALAILRGVREPGKGKLALRAAIDAALEQGAAFKKWSEGQAPIGRVQVWVESHLVMTVSPEDSSVKLRAFRFEVPSPQDAVMQILKADKGEEPIVLLNLPLCTVPLIGLDESRALPNGQRIRLVIAPGEKSRFDVLVAFVPEEVPQLLMSAKSAEVMKSEEKSSVSAGDLGKRWAYITTFLRQPRLAWVALASALIVFGTLMLNTQRKLIEHEHQVERLDPPNGKGLAEANVASRSTRITPESDPTFDQVRPVPKAKRRNLMPKEQTATVPSILILVPDDFVRGTSNADQAVRRPPVPLSPSSYHFELKLPPDSKAGMYKVSLVNPYDATLFETTTRSGNGKTLLVILNRKLLSSGTYALRVSSGDDAPIRYSLNIATR